MFAVNFGFSQEVQDNYAFSFKDSVFLIDDAAVIRLVDLGIRKNALHADYVIENDFSDGLFEAIMFHSSDSLSFITHIYFRKPKDTDPIQIASAFGQIVAKKDGAVKISHIGKFDEAEIKKMLSLTDKMIYLKLSNERYALGTALVQGANHVVYNFENPIPRITNNKTDFFNFLVSSFIRKPPLPFTEKISVVKQLFNQIAQNPNYVQCFNSLKPSQTTPSESFIYSRQYLLASRQLRNDKEFTGTSGWAKSIDFIGGSKRTDIINDSTYAKEIVGGWNRPKPNYHILDNKRFDGFDYLTLNQKPTFDFEYRLRNDSIFFDGLFEVRSTIDGWRLSTYMAAGKPDDPYRKMVRGVIREVGEFMNGVRNGWVYKYDWKGRQVSKAFYNQGQLNLDSTGVFSFYVNMDKTNYESPRAEIFLEEKDSKALSLEIKESPKVFASMAFDSMTNVLVDFNENSITLPEKDFYSKYFFNYSRDKYILHFSFTKSQKTSYSGHFDILCEADPTTGGFKPLGNIEKWIWDGKDLIQENREGLFKGFGIDERGVPFYTYKSDIRSKFFSSFKSIKGTSDKIGAEEFELGYDSEDGPYFHYRGKNLSFQTSAGQITNFIQKAAVELSKVDYQYLQLTDFQNVLDIMDEFDLRRGFSDTYGFDFLIDTNDYSELDITSFEDANAQFDLFEKFEDYVNTSVEFIEDTEKANRMVLAKQSIRKSKKDLQFFFPEVGVPYMWATVQPPTYNPLVRMDTEGSGVLKSRRKSGRKHGGVDYEANPGDVVYAATTGKAYISNGDTREKYKYDDTVQAITIETNDGVKVKTIYLKPMPWLKNGQDVVIGQQIGISIDMRWRFHGKKNMERVYSDKMKNHIHFEIILPDGTRTDRALMFRPKRGKN